jgi:thioredoxin-related protein
MKKITLFSLAIFFAIFSMAQQNITAISVGTEAPATNIIMKSVSGKETSIKQEMKENGVLIMFSCNTCPYVIKNQERMLQIAATAKANNVGVIVINSNEAQFDDVDSYAAMQTYAKQQGYNFNYVVDEKAAVANAFGATRTPELFLLNKNGILVYKGAIDDSPADAKNVKIINAKNAIESIAQGKAISVTETKSIGCTIKRKG